MAESLSPNTLRTINARALSEKELPPLTWYVSEMLTQGLTLVSAPPKYGKSWLALQLCLAVARGRPFLGFQTTQAGALYLALEDSFRRLQTRINALCKGETPPDAFRVTTASLTIDTGLVPQLEGFLQAHPDTGLIVIDLLQNIRPRTAGNAQLYSADYEALAPLQKLAQTKNVALVVITHSRKQEDSSDPFRNLSGTNGLMGAADATIVLTRESRTADTTTLHLTGRDVEGMEIVLRRDGSQWLRVGTREELDALALRERLLRDPLLKTIKDFQAESPSGFRTTAQELFARMSERHGFGDYTSTVKIGDALRSQVIMDELDRQGWRVEFERTTAKRLIVFHPKGGVAA